LSSAHNSTLTHQKSETTQFFGAKILDLQNGSRGLLSKIIDLNNLLELENEQPVRSQTICGSPASQTSSDRNRPGGRHTNNTLLIVTKRICSFICGLFFKIISKTKRKTIFRVGAV
jgi:hypothetical protein